MRGKVCCFLALVVAGGGIAPAVRAEVTAAQVNTAIQDGVKFLLKQQRPDGSWTEHNSEPGGGLSALCTLALHNCGVPKDDPQVAKALDYLASIDKPGRTYSSSLIVMALCQADPVKYKLQITQIAHKWIEAQQIRDGGPDSKGGWSYFGKGQADNSNTQFAMLALHEAERAGVKVTDQTWQLAFNYWTNKGMQLPGGGYGYRFGGAGPGEQPTGSMTSAAIASLIIAGDRLRSGDATIAGGRIQCCGPHEPDTALDDAFAWLGKVFSVQANPGNEAGWLLYYLYAVERVGRMSGQRYIGGHDWFREGAEMLVARQKDTLNGSWIGVNHVERDPVISTALALLFLAKGRRPVVMAKLKHDLADDWDHHRRAVQNLTGRIEKQWRRDLSWQTIDYTLRAPVLDKDGKQIGQRLTATPAELLEAPVLFISGSGSLNLDAEQRQNLKSYIEQGGFLFVEACDGAGCNGAAFDASFRALMRDLFPDSELRKLPPDHAVWFAQEKVDPKHLPADPEFWLWGLDACCRTSVVYCPKSLSCYWELAHPYRESGYPPELKAQIETVTRIGGNVVAYATNRELKEKLDRPSVVVSTAGLKSPRGALVVPKLSHGGGSDDAPAALNNLLLVMERQLQMQVDLRKQLIAPLDERLYDFPLIFTHGRRAFRFSAAERKALKDYLDRGGFLFADAICANPQFAESLRAELKQIYPEANFARIPPSHPLFTDEFRGFNLQSVTLRDPQIRAGDDPLTAKLVKTTPLLEGLEIDGRLAVILSPYDISCALEKGASMDCKGYLPADAARLGANVLLYALQQ
ncbi:MAG: DUF4159 domain-containing protein [Pirellulaceae bacterium]|nr:DUF4159 domain-containing protein [Pirellulaceae bacterium]